MTTPPFGLGLSKPVLSDAAGGVEGPSPSFLLNLGQGERHPLDKLRVNGRRNA